MVPPFFLALTITPSMGPSSVELTTPVSAAALGVSLRNGDSSTAARPAAPISNRVFVRMDSPLTSTSSRLLAILPVQQLFHKLNAFEFHQLYVLLKPPVNRHADLPRPGEHVLILDGGLIQQSVPAAQRVAFHHVQ